MEVMKHVYRIDKFRVPESAQSEFLARFREMREFLRQLPGFVEEQILKQVGGPGVFNFVTIAVWENAEAIAAAREAAMAHQKAKGFNPQELFARLNIQADLAHYEEIVA